MSQPVDWDAVCASTQWTPKGAFEVLRLEMCDSTVLADFLQRYQRHIQDAMIDAGADKIRELWYAEKGPMTRIIR